LYKSQVFSIDKKELKPNCVIITIVSKVWINEESLAEMLKANELAKGYNREGAMQEWRGRKC
tara:strand:+ start:139 stop:324 length:186 start_codon:yes stop_codon:yes gene_type:complete